MTADEPKPAKRAAREASEAAMLAAACRILLETPGPDVLSVLRPVEVARRSDPPRTTGAFYNIWPTHADFRRAVLDYVLSLSRFHGDRDALDAMVSVADSPLGLDVMVRQIANFRFEAMRANPATKLQVALWARHAADPEIADRVKALYDGISDRVNPFYAAVFERTGRRMRAPYTIEQLSVALTALIEGLHLRWAVDPGAVADEVAPPPGADDTEGPWTLFASTAYVLIMGMTEAVADTP
jgi:BetI-type transcriptional repressor, C-terminal